MGVATGLEQCEVARGLQNCLDSSHGSFLHCHSLRIIQSLRERDHGTGDLGSKTQLLTVTQRFAQGHTVFIRIGHQRCFCGGANAASRSIQNAPQRQGISGIGNSHQIRHHVFDFGAFVELCAANDSIGNSRANQNVFQSTCLGVSTIKNRHIRVGEALGAQRDHLVGNKLCLIVGAIAGETHDLVPGANFGEKVLCFPVKIVANHGVGGVQNVLG